MTDGFRYGFFGQSDIEPLISLAVIFMALALLSMLAVQILKRGYKLCP